MQEIALAVMRLQPLHRGHELVINTMLKECDAVIVALGSINRLDERNPYGFEMRRTMVRTLWPDVRTPFVIGLEDIGAPTKKAWTEYVLRTISGACLPAPTRYYAGSREDAVWFEGVLPVRIIDRATLGQGITATAIRNRGLGDQIPAAVNDLLKGHHGF